MDILLHSSSILLILFLIVAACVIFTNAVEHLGKELNLSEGAVGSILAAVGTALPETIVPLVAIIGAYVTGSSLEVGHEVGVGAILGAPFLLSTLAFFVTGLAVVLFARAGKRGFDMPVNTVVVFRDLHYFFITYTIAILCAFIPNVLIKHLMAFVLLALYLVYVIKTIRCCSISQDCEVEDLEILYLTKFIEVKGPLHFTAIIVQLLFALVGIIILAHFFVKEIEYFSHLLKINPFILSLILCPIATELPEKFNSVIWIKAKKDTLAMGNITGAMVFQSCIPTAVGILLTPWVFNQSGIVNIIIVYLSTLFVHFSIVKNKGVLKPSALMMGGLFYIIYLVYVLSQI